MQRWTVHLEGGPRRVNHAAVAIDDWIYSFGGYCTGEDYDTTRPMDVHVLHTVSLRWKLLPMVSEHDPEYDSIPYQRYGHSAVGYDECAYIWGGRNDSDGACNTLFQYDTGKKKWSIVQTKGTRPGARDGHSACVINKRIYIFGGYEEELDRFSDDIHTFCFETNMWEFVRTKGSPARWRDFHTAIGIGNVMYVFGGRSDIGGEIFTNNEMYCNRLQTYNTVTKTWHEPVTTGRSPTGRRSHSVFVYENCMYIFGGYNGERGMHFKDVFKFDPAQNKWSLVKVKGRGPCARRRQCCSRIGTKVFLFGGTSPTSTDDNHTEQDSNLMDHSDLHVLDLAPSLKTLAQLTVIEHKLDSSCLPRDLRWELASMTTNNSISRPLNTNG